jgi:hypothetical protein
MRPARIPFRHNSEAFDPAASPECDEETKVQPATALCRREPGPDPPRDPSPAPGVTGPQPPCECHALPIARVPRLYSAIPS